MRWYHYIAWFFGGAFLANTLPHLNRHRGESHLSSPASPPDMRVRIRRFGRIELFSNVQPGKSK